MSMHCPPTPNCVSSFSDDPHNRVEVLNFKGPMSEANERMLTILKSLKRTRITTVRENYLQAEALSPVFGFVDEIQVFFDDSAKHIHLKSASRRGYFDFGVNRRRIKSLCARFAEGQ